MFKEFLCGMGVLLLFYLLCRILMRKKKKALPVLIWGILGLSIIVNSVYNLCNIYPDTYLETSTGVYKYGSLRGNLFAYNEDFRYRDEILFPLLRDRKVVLDACPQGDFYMKFFNMYSKGSEALRADVPDYLREYILEDYQEDGRHCYETPFNMIGLMDYVKEDIPKELEADFDEKIFPTLHIDMDSIKDKDELMVVVEPDYSLYIIGLSND